MFVLLTRQGPFTGRASESYELSAVNNIGQWTHLADILGDQTSMYRSTSNTPGKGREREEKERGWKRLSVEEFGNRAVSLPSILFFLPSLSKYPTAPITALTNPVLNDQGYACIVQEIAYNLIPTTFVISRKLIAAC